MQTEEENFHGTNLGGHKICTTISASTGIYRFQSAARWQCVPQQQESPESDHYHMDDGGNTLSTRNGPWLQCVLNHFCKLLLKIKFSINFT